MSRLCKILKLWFTAGLHPRDRGDELVGLVTWLMFNMGASSITVTAVGWLFNVPETHQGGTG